MTTSVHSFVWLMFTISYLPRQAKMAWPFYFQSPVFFQHIDHSANSQTLPQPLFVAHRHDNRHRYDIVFHDHCLVNIKMTKSEQKSRERDWQRICDESANTCVVCRHSFIKSWHLPWPLTCRGLTRPKKVSSRVW